MNSNPFQDFHITQIWHKQHPANQACVEVATERMIFAGNNAFAQPSDKSPVKNYATFKLIPSGNGYPVIPLGIDGQCNVDRAGEYQIIGTGNGFRMTSGWTNFKTGAWSGEIGPFYTDVKAECPFQVLINSWSIFDRDGRGFYVDDKEVTLYLFLGSTALQLQEYPGQDIHVWELIKFTIPLYEDTVGKSFAEIEPQIIGNVVFGLWKLGGREFCYDSARGAASFLWGSDFQLGRMLRKQARSCSCFDLAALVYTAFKSFGMHPERTLGSGETDVSGSYIFPISVHTIQNWGYIQPSTLFGWQDTAAEPCNNPFWLNRTRPLVDQNDPARSSFGWHCFTLISTSSSQQKVVDMCTAVKDYHPDAKYSDLQHLFEAGHNDLENYVSLTDEGYESFQQGNIMPVPIKSVSIQLSPDDKRSRKIREELMGLSVMSPTPDVTLPGFIRFNQFPHLNFREEHGQRVQTLIVELLRMGRIPVFGWDP